MTSSLAAELSALKAELDKISAYELGPDSAEHLENAKRIAARLAKGEQ